jgi:serralysin
VFDYNSVSESGPGAAHRDKILDFDGDDLIDLRTIDAKTGVSGNNAFTFIGKNDFTGDDPFKLRDGKGELRFNDNGATCTVQGDVNGDGKADFEILVHKSSLSAGDFLL